MDYLYHASPHSTLKLIEPKRTLSKNIYIGDYVFATDDFKLAVMYLANKGIAKIMGSKDDKSNIVICSTPENYIKNDNNRTIYKLSSKSFKSTPQRELMGHEQVSDVAVRPVSKTVYESSLTAMKEAGITIYFVDQTIFNKLIAHPENKRIILSNIEPYS